MLVLHVRTNSFHASPSHEFPAGLNIGAHKEAAEHFLSALSMQEASGGGETSDQLWFTLRRAFLTMVRVSGPILASVGNANFQDRPDLAAMTQPENRGNLEVFRKDGFDF